jgi:hypothetical protein
MNLLLLRSQSINLMIVFEVGIAVIILSCLQAVVCATVQSIVNNLGQLSFELFQRAFALSEVLRTISQEMRSKFRNFDLDYIDCPFNESKLFNVK